ASMNCAGRSASRRSSRCKTVTISPTARLRMCLLSVRKADLPSCLGIPWLLAAMRRGGGGLGASRAPAAPRPRKWGTVCRLPARPSLFPFPGHHRWRTLTRTSPPRGFSFRPKICTNCPETVASGNAGAEAIGSSRLRPRSPNCRVVDVIDAPLFGAIAVLRVDGVPLREQLRTPTSTVTHERLGFGASPNLPQSSLILGETDRLQGDPEEGGVMDVELP